MAAHTPQTNYSIGTTRNEVATENLQINRRRKKTERRMFGMSSTKKRERKMRWLQRMKKRKIEIRASTIDKIID